MNRLVENPKWTKPLAERQEMADQAMAPHRDKPVETREFNTEAPPCE